MMNRLCSKKAAGLQRTLTNISDDFKETPSPQPLENIAEEVRFYMVTTINTFAATSNWYYIYFYYCFN